MSLFEVPGFEAGLACALLAALAVGPWAGIRAALRHAPTAAFARAALSTVGVQAAALAALAAMAALRTPCRPLAGAPLFALVAFPSGLLAASLGVLCGTATRRARRAAALYAAAAALSLAATLAEGYLGPSAAAYDHLLGWWPGPIYDEALEADRRLALFRLGTLAWTAAAVAAAVALRRRGAVP
ncbi:MAG TPA: type VI secretion system protein, partial [Anaeromyxobacteraceae bacterium]|nr:type VI secretion system protein [Anaeromyxobacteraceae bacterium]